jgi:DnaJ-class molecular chaperone
MLNLYRSSIKQSIHIRTFSNLVKPATCYYKVLNISTQADRKEIKSSYYQLAKKYHPDTIMGNHKPTEAQFKEIDSKFKAITEAYSVLSDQTKR